MKKKTKLPGSDLICKTLENLGIEVIFGLPGTQNIHLYRSLHHSSIRAITPTSELAASFMANGYYRSSGKIAAITTIPGPGFTYALAGIAEAFLDSVPMLCIVGNESVDQDKKYQHQAIEQEKIIKPVVKETFKIKKADEIQDTINKAYLSSLSEEPGPVYIEVDKSVYSESALFDPGLIKQYSPLQPDSFRDISPKAIAEILKSKRILFYLGQGASHASNEIREIVEFLNAPVLTTSSGRGILPEDHPLLFPFNVVIRGGGKAMKEMIKSSDLIVALGCKFSFNGSGAYQFEFPEKKLIHVDSSPKVLNANYPARLAIQGDVRDFVVALRKESKKTKDKHKGWPDNELIAWRKKALDDIKNKKELESAFKGGFGSTPDSFFEKLQKNLPGNSIVVTDSGQHQMLTRKYYKVPNVRGLIIPSNFQSMGFAIPAAIGAKLAVPNSTVVVIIGDAGFNISAMELLTALREKTAIKVIVFNDKRLGLIRTNQINKFGFDYSTKVPNPNYAKLAESFNIEFVGLLSENGDYIKTNLKSNEITLFEVGLKDSVMFHIKRSRHIIRRIARKMIDKLPNPR